MKKSVIVIEINMVDESWYPTDIVYEGEDSHAEGRSLTEELDEFLEGFPVEFEDWKVTIA